jgi:ABC-type branched-subunit amino acid transport system substrate-binding protein
MMLMAAIKDGGESREGIRDNLDGPNGLDGATGTIQFDYNGEAVKELFILTVKKKKIVEILRQPREGDPAVEQSPKRSF